MNVVFDDFDNNGVVTCIYDKDLGSQHPVVSRQ